MLPAGGVAAAGNANVRVHVPPEYELDESEMPETPETVMVSEPFQERAPELNVA